MFICYMFIAGISTNFLVVIEYDTKLSLRKIYFRLNEGDDLTLVQHICHKSRILSSTAAQLTTCLLSLALFLESTLVQRQELTISLQQRHLRHL